METKKYSESNYDQEKFAEKLDQLLTHDLPIRLSNLLIDRIGKPAFLKQLIEEDAETFGDKSPDYIATSMANYLLDKSEKNPAYAGLIMLLTDFNNELSQLVNEFEGVSTDVHKIDDKLVQIMPTMQKFSGQVEGFKVATESYQAIAQDLRTNFNKLASIEKVELLIGQSSNKLSNDFRVVIEGQDGKGGLRSELTNLDKSNISLAKTVEELANKIGDHYNNTGLAGQLNNLEAKLVDSEKQLSSDITKSNQELTEKINGLEKNFTASISESNQELTEKINGLEKNFTASISESNQELTEKINGLDKNLTAGISESNQELTEKINGLDKKLTNKINGLETNFTASISESNQELTEKINGLDKKLTNKINGLETNFTASISESNQELTEKINGLETNFTAGISQSNQELTEKINGLETNFTAGISQSNQELTEKINDLDKKLTEKINDLENKLTGWKSVMPNIVTILIVLVGLWGGFASMSGNIKDGVQSDLQLLLERELKQEDGILSNRMKTIEDKMDQMETRIIEQIKNED